MYDPLKDHGGYEGKRGGNTRGTILLSVLFLAAVLSATK